MGDAQDGTVPVADPEDTVDGAEPRTEARSLPTPVLGALRDFGELIEVDRSRYVITRELAKGGMGRVLEARDLRLGRSVAIKELLPKNRDIARRFEREARITARLQHPAIIHVYEAGVWPGGEPFYAMPLVDGRSLDKVVAERKTLHDRLALLPRVIAVADALAYAHANNVIHRDLKPGNVLVGEYGETVVIDWGLAKDLGAHTDPKESMRLPVRALPEETASGSVVGTPAYMPPEQARGDGVDQRADVYALGALLYKVLSGRAPYKGSVAKEVVDLVKAGPPTPIEQLVPDAPAELVAIVNKAMARAPADRYVTASELAQDLQRFETGQLVGAHRYTVGQLVRRWAHRYRVAIGVSIVALTVLVVIGALSIQSVIDARDRAEVRRTALLDERGRSELRLGHAGIALAYLVEAARGEPSPARQLLIAEARRPFLAQKQELLHAQGDAVVAASPDGTRIVTVAARRAEVWTADGQSERVLGEVAGANAIAFDVAGKRVAFGGDDGVVRVWTLDGAPVFERRAHDGAIRDVTFALDGRLATVGNDGAAHVWNLVDGTSITPSCAPGDGLPTAALTTVRFAALGLFAAAGAEDGSGCVWAYNGTVIAMLRGHTAAITALEWSPSMTWIATASADGTAGVWSPFFGKLIVAPLRHGRPVTALAIVGERTLISGDSDGGLHLWTIPSERPFGEDGNARAQIESDISLAGHAGPIVAVARSPDGRYVATAGADRLAKLWSATTGAPIATFEQADALTSIAFAGGTLVTGSRDGTARLWDTTAVAPREQLVDSPVHALAVSRTGVVVAARDDSRISVLPGDDVLAKHDGRVLAAAFTPDGAHLISAGEDAAPLVWDMGTREAHAAGPEAPGPLVSVATAPDGDRFATAGGDLRMWSLAQHNARVLDASPFAVVAFAPAGDLLVAGGTGGEVRAWSASRVVSSHTLRHPIRSLAFSADGRWLAIGGPAAIEIRAVVGGRIADRATTTIDGAPGDVRALVFACDGACLVSGNDAGLAEVWDTATGRLLATRDPHAGAISGLARDGDTLWIATEGKIVGAWPLRVEKRGRDELECFIAEHVPWRLGTDDVVSRSEGGSDEQRRSHCK
ncbi:MAG: protein kinase [Deltaproteobacteria bacterium]|nr:protein kinase [Deltaproteobacteria bacterium]